MSFLRLQLLPAQLLWWRKLRCSWLPILCLEGRVCCASVLQCSSSSCHPLTSHWCCLPLPLPWRRAGLVAEPLLCCWRPSTLRISVLPSIAEGASCGAGKKRNLHFSRQKNKGEFLSFRRHNPTKGMLHCHCQLLFSYGCSIHDTFKMRIFFRRMI